jgi:hypothetical protein
MISQTREDLLKNIEPFWRDIDEKQWESELLCKNQCISDSLD